MKILFRIFAELINSTNMFYKLEVVLGLGPIEGAHLTKILE